MSPHGSRSFFVGYQLGAHVHAQSRCGTTICALLSQSPRHERPASSATLGSGSRFQHRLAIDESPVCTYILALGETSWDAYDGIPPEYDNHAVGWYNMGGKTFLICE
jgi:hypothetical protein